MLSINVSELIWTIINFFLLYFLLKRFLYTPIVRFLDARQARLDEALDQENRARAAAEANEQAIESVKAQRREEAARILESAQREDAERSRLACSQAKADAAQAMEDAGARLRFEQERSRETLGADAGELAGILAEQLLGEGK